MHPLGGYCKNKTKPKITSVGEDLEKLEPLCTGGGNGKWCRCYEKQYGGFPKNEIWNYHMIQNFYLRMYIQELEVGTQEGI